MSPRCIPSLKKHGFNAGALHGDMSQPARTETLERFKAGEIQILVASDVAARGLDIADMSHVFNFDVPFSPEDYVHRIGRTGRAGKTGHSFTLATPAEGGLIEAIEKLIGTDHSRAIEIPGMAELAFEPSDGRRRGRGGRSRGRTPPAEKPEGRRRESGRSRSRASRVLRQAEIQHEAAASGEAAAAPHQEIHAEPVVERTERAPRRERTPRADRPPREAREPRPPREPRR